MKHRTWHFQKSLRCAAVALALAAGTLHGEISIHVTSGRVENQVGELGGKMKFLKEAHLPPGPGESNHYLEMWKPGPGLRDIARAQGLTNNNALFVNSHGHAVASARGTRYVLYPHDSRIPRGEPLTSYSFTALDLSRLFSPATATGIHNIYISGCNKEGAFDAGELRRSFPNATNITHMAAGELGFEPMFIQAMTLPSWEVTPLFETPEKKISGGTAYALGSTSGPNARRMAPFLAELFQPEAEKPYRVQFAGRELLAPLSTAPRKAD